MIVYKEYALTGQLSSSQIRLINIQILIEVSSLDKELTVAHPGKYLRKDPFSVISHIDFNKWLERWLIQNLNGVSAFLSNITDLHLNSPGREGFRSSYD